MFAFKKFSQQDPQWKNLQLGLDPSATLGKLGCLLTDLAMVATGFGFEETPATLNQKLAALGKDVGFSGALVRPAALPLVLPGILFRDFLFCRDTPAPLDRIDAALAADYPVIVELDYSPGAGLQNHWVLLYDRRDGDYLLQDPWPYPPEAGPVGLSHSRFAFAGKPEKVFTAVVWLEGSLPPVNKPEGAVSVYTIEDGLALRSQPLIDPANLIKRLPLLTELYSLENVAATLQKVGNANQWLHVQDTTGAQGFSAAWYLNIRKEVPGQPPVVAPQDGAMLQVYSAVDQLAFRSAPQVSPDTLIKRLAMDSRLDVLDPPAEAVAKIGVVNAWLQVRDAEGDEGYVAAWYVTLTTPVALGPEVSEAPQPTTVPPVDPPAPPATALHVQTTVPSLALRSQPVIVPATLIKRVGFAADLVVLEAEEEARKKIGVSNQWLKVRDSEHVDGYIAAWFVRAVSP